MYYEYNFITSFTRVGTHIQIKIKTIKQNKKIHNSSVMNAVTSNRHFLIKYKYLILHLEEKKESQIVEHTVLLKNLTNQIGFLHSNIIKKLVD